MAFQGSQERGAVHSQEVEPTELITRELGTYTSRLERNLLAKAETVTTLCSRSRISAWAILEQFYFKTNTQLFHLGACGNQLER